MRRPARLALLALPALLIILAAGYAGFWYWTADRARTALQDWAEARRVEGFAVGWDRYAIGGFPWTLRLTIEKLVFGKAGADPGFEARAPELVAFARPWALRHWRFTASQGGRLAIEPGQARPAVRALAARLAGSIEPDSEAASAGGKSTRLALAADGLTIDAGAHLAIEHAEAAAVLPQRAAASHLDTWAAATVRGAGITLPVAVAPLGATIDRLEAQIAIKGSIPAGNRRQALEAWRQDGGTVEVETLDLDWSKLALSAKGTLALDETLQPEGALSASIRGYDAVIDALVGAGTLKAGDGAIAKLALGLLAKPGPDGAAQITAPLTLQNGQVYIGPARLARLPLFTWE